MAGCASSIMQSYVGKSVTEAMLDYGQPVSVFDLPNGTRAFQWKIDSSGVIAQPSTSTSQVYGSGGWASVSTTSTNYVPFEQSCLYTLLGQKNGQDWTIVGFRKPNLLCE